MDNISIIEIAIVVLVVIVLFFGKRVADTIRGAGKGIKEYRTAKKDDLNTQ